EARQQRQVLAAEHFDVGEAADAGAGEDVGNAVAVHIAGRYANPAGERRIVGEETELQRAGLGVEDLDVRPAAFAGPGHDDPRLSGCDVDADRGPSGTAMPVVDFVE